jgi:WW domain-binding protein 4
MHTYLSSSCMIKYDRDSEGAQYLSYLILSRHIVITQVTLTLNVSDFILCEPAPVVISLMSEYWISKKKYFCTYCDIYIADDVPSRSHHENGMRHQGNKERFVKGLYKAGEKKKKDDEEERRSMKTVEAAAQRAYALDVGAGRGGIGSSSSSVPAPKATPPPPPKKPSNPYANYTTAEFLGYKDPDAERIQAELERKRSQGVAGEWELLPTHSAASAQPSGPILNDTKDVKPLLDGDAGVIAGTKREADAAAVDDDDSRGWKLRKKTARLGEVYDPGVIPIRLKAKKEAPEDSSITGSSVAATSGNGIVPANTTGAKPTDLPKWTKVEWKKPDRPSDVPSIRFTEDSSAPAETTAVKIENDTSITEGPNEPPSLSPVPKVEPVPDKLEVADNPSNEGAGGSLFKKRKGKPSTAGVGRRKRDRY